MNRYAREEWLSTYEPCKRGQTAKRSGCTPKAKSKPGGGGDVHGPITPRQSAGKKAAATRKNPPAAAKLKKQYQEAVQAWAKAGEQHGPGSPEQVAAKKKTTALRGKLLKQQHKDAVQAWAKAGETLGTDSPEYATAKKKAQKAREAVEGLRRKGYSAPVVRLWIATYSDQARDEGGRFASGPGGGGGGDGSEGAGGARIRPTPAGESAANERRRVALRHEKLQPILDRMESGDMQALFDVFGEGQQDHIDTLSALHDDQIKLKGDAKQYRKSDPKKAAAAKKRLKTVSEALERVKARSKGLSGSIPKNIRGRYGLPGELFTEAFEQKRRKLSETYSADHKSR